MCNTMMAAEYQRRFDRHDACTYGHDSAVAIHPGIVATSLATGFFTQVGGGGGGRFSWVARLPARSPGSSEGPLKGDM